MIGDDNTKTMGLKKIDQRENVKGLDFQWPFIKDE